MASRWDAQSYQRLYWVIALAAFLAGVAVIFVQNDAFYGEFQRYFSALPEQPQGPGRTVRLTIDFGDGRKRAFVGTSADGMTVLAALRAAAEAGRFAVSTDARGRLADVAGYRAGGGRRWAAYRNDLPLQDLPGHVEVGPGDRVLLRYE